MKRFLVPSILLFLTSGLFAADELRDYLELQTRYWGISVSAQDLNQLVDLKRKADQSGLSMEERTDAYKHLFQFVQKLRGISTDGNVPAALAAGYWTEGQPIVPSTQGFSKPGELGAFVTRGRGTVPMVLIPDLGMDASVFESYMQRNQDQFTFYSVTLPGFGGTKPYAPPKKMDFGAMTWWNYATTAVVDLIKTQKMNRPLILGHQAGAYLAMKIALLHPDLVRGVVVLNGLLHSPMSGMPENPTPADRIRFMNGTMPAELFPNTSQAHFKRMMMQMTPFLCKDRKAQESLGDLIAQSRPSVWWNYFAELATTDLTHDIKALKVPMLVLPSLYDPETPGGTDNSRIAMEQWKPLDHATSSLPIRVVPIEDCRAYAMVDQPAKLDELVRSWTERLREG